jgi:hypothetical protein
MKMSTCRLFAAALALVILSVPIFSIARQPTAADRVISLKATLAQSQMVLRQYEWLETTVVNVKGEDKSQKQERCYYGADGKLQKVLLTQPPLISRAAFCDELSAYTYELASCYLTGQWPVWYDNRSFTLHIV